MYFGVPDSKDKIVQDGLIYYLDAGQLRSYTGSGTTWTNLYLTGKNGTLTNGPTFTSSSGGGIVFDGTDDYVTLGDPSANNLYSTTGMTFSVWCYTNFFLGDRQVMGTAASIGGARRGPILNLGSGGGTNYAFFYIINDIGQQFFVRNTTSLPFTSNIHLTCTYDRVNLKIYYNGVYEAQTAHTRDIYKQGSTIHGIGSRDADTAHWNGRVYQCIMYDRALTDSQILNNYNVTKTRFGL